MTRSETWAKLIKLGMETAASNGSFPSSIWSLVGRTEWRNRCRLLKMGWTWVARPHLSPQDRWMPAEWSKLFRVVWKSLFIQKSPTKGERAPWVLLKSLSPSKINMLDKRWHESFLKLALTTYLFFGTVPYLNTWQLLSLPSESLWNIQARMFVTKSSLS